MPSSAPTFVLFGATGDLARRMLFPSLYFLHLEGLLTDGQRIIGASRSERTSEDFRAQMEDWVRERTGEHFDAEKFASFAERVTYLSVNANELSDFERLKEEIGGSDQEAVFYLSTSPAIFAATTQNLKAVGLSHSPNRIVVEKPIGHDFSSNVAINDALADAFDENRTFRIDHYLGKETVQNLIALRFGNTIFEPLWSATSIDSVEITIAEAVGVEGRGDYYDDYGAIRDMVQNHLLQLLCLVAMEPPASLDAEAVRNEKVKVLKTLAPITAENVESKTVRGQYSEGFDEKGGKAPDYLTDADRKSSNTESFVAITAELRNWRWKGVPFYIQTGKRMGERKTRIVISFRPVPHSIFSGAVSANELIITLQPQEEIRLQIMSKRPGLTSGAMSLQELGLNLSLSDHLPEDQQRRRIAYEQLILDALNNNPALFVQRDEQEAAWRWIDGIVAAWDQQNMKPKSYKAGTSGPSAKHTLTERNEHSWYD
ncbi:glucose-6-phosphate dehydrogenase [Parvularcula marina]|uniref:Glucose-6-phosphate 1-dehydrogenase n=1 Tax=Parvularcula marina TaxID=2292771 RepID=A0A371RI63_9PROT|nr:glucose-6-phosphate dehydrogenase [Parvularcula marina]RFB05118.1 glucose-6-phosphate dehydrogenase [Parvularcula marina]